MNMERIKKETLYWVESNLNREVFRRLNNLHRWTSLISEGKYNELAKQALNCLVSFILATEYETRENVRLDWNAFPKIALFRAYQKVFVNYDIPENILHEICRMGEIPEGSFVQVTKEIIEEKTSSDFADWLFQGCGTTEEKIYRAATKIATHIELRDIRQKINGDYDDKYDELVRSSEKYEKIPGFLELKEGLAFDVLRNVSHLRNQNRWAAYSYQSDCSVLGHLFDTAVFAYLMSFEKGYKEEIATKNFFMGIFHDVPEAFTMDIPSPIKDKIPGFRQLTEAYELRVMEEKFYPSFSEPVQKALRDIMFENEENSDMKCLMKGADYMSAVSEIWRQAAAGSKDPELMEALLNHGIKFNSGKAEIGDPEARLYDEIKEFCKKCFT